MANRRDVLLAALALADSRSLTPVQAQKAMFLIAAEARNLAPGNFYRFDKYNYGPFSSDIYSDLSVLEQAGFLTVEQPFGARVRRYQLTNDGVRGASASREKLDPPLAEYLAAVVAWVTSLSFPDLVRAIYAKYPEYKENSVFSG